MKGTTYKRCAAATRPPKSSSASALTPPDGQVVKEHVVDQFPDGDTEWEQRFLAAREEAERRAFHLDADRPEIIC